MSNQDVYFDGSVRTQYLDPVSFVPNGRCAFELDGDKMAYLANMRLLDLGCTSNGNIRFSRGLGCLALIKNIRLLDARTELSALRNPAQYLFFKNANRSNAINASNDSYLKRNGFGFEIDSTNNKPSKMYNVGLVTDDPSTTARGYLDLREVFPILNQISILPVQIFKNLRIEIEFDANVNNQILSDITNTISVSRPVLAVDTITNSSLVNKSIEAISKGGVIFDEIEWDNYIIPAVDTSLWTVGQVATQSVSNHTLGFKGKVVDRLLCCKQLIDKTKELDANAVQGFGAVASSQAVLQQTTQYRLNGKSVIPGFNGVSGNNERLGMICDEFGDLNCYPGSNLYEWNKGTDNFQGAGANNGQMAFDSVKIGARVADLVISMSRTNNRDAGTKAATNAALQVNLYAEVKKALAVTGGSYRIVYA